MDNVRWGLYTQPSYPQALTSGTSTNIASWMSAAAAEPSAVGGGPRTRSASASASHSGGGSEEADDCVFECRATGVCVGSRAAAAAVVTDTRVPGLDARRRGGACVGREGDGEASSAPSPDATDVGEDRSRE